VTRRAVDSVDARAVFDGSVWPMVIVDDERRYVDANAAALEAFDMTREELLRHRFDDLAIDEQRGRVERGWHRFRADGRATGTVDMQLHSGRRVEFRFSAIADVGPGRHLSILLPPQNVTRPNARGRLSTREREILGRVARGEDGPEIAEALVVSPATVRTHIGNAVRKLGARSRAHAVALALRSGLLDDRQLD
jgi:DNA-binding CsgD family transcriptional regulator